MKLTPDAIDKLEQLIQTAMIAGLKKVIIEPGKVRGIDEKQSVAVISKNNVPDLGGKQIGINRIDQLFARMNLVKAQGNLDIEATEAANGTDISLLDLTCGKTKAQFRCAAVEAVKSVPKNIADTISWELKLLARELPTIIQGVSAMGSDDITIASKDGKLVTFECVDTTKDVFVTELSESANWIGTGNSGTVFCHKYPAKTLLALLKAAPHTGPKTAECIINLGDGGILSLVVNKFDFYVIPTT